MPVSPKSLKNLVSLPKGHHHGGDKLAGRRMQLKAEMLKATSRKDIRAIALKLIEDAKAGSVQAAHEILDRVMGKASQPVEMSGELTTRSEIDAVAHALNDAEFCRLATQLEERLAILPRDTGESSN